MIYKKNNRFDKKNSFVPSCDDDDNNGDEKLWSLTGFSKSSNAVIVVVHSCNKIKYG